MSDENFLSRWSRRKSQAKVGTADPVEEVPAQPAPEGQADGPRRASRDRSAPSHEQPEFLRRPVRRPRPVEGEEPAAAVPPSGDDTGRD